MARGMVDQPPEEALDEYSGMSIVDIAHAVVNWEPDSEDQRRAIAAIQSRRPGIGHNRPALSEQLVEELAPLRARQAKMIEVAGQAVIIDDESAGKVTDLSVQVKALAEEIRQARDDRLLPYLTACQLINDQFNPLIAPLAATYGDRTTGLRGMLGAWVQKREAAAAAERARLAEEQRQREEEAAAARRAVEEKKAAGAGTVAAELNAIKAEDAAETAHQRAEAIRPNTPIRSQLGTVGTVRTIAYDITNLRHVLGWAVKQPTILRFIEAETRKWVGAYLRQLGVDAVEKGVEIPGVKAWIERSAAVRR